MPEVPEVDVHELAEALEQGAPLIDVREPAEYAEGRAPGAALVPLGEAAARSGEVPTDRTVYVICRSGARSASAVGLWRAQGIDAVNVAGGTLAWIEAGFPVETGSGTSG